MGKIKDYISKIVVNGKKEDMDELSEMLIDTLYEIKENYPEEYDEYECRLYEMANGKVITEEMAEEWVNSMKPRARWNIDETNNAMQQLGYRFDPIDFYVVANMMYSDNYDIVKDDEQLALNLAYNWLVDQDIPGNKLYNYWKYVTKG